jgi:hypothetical protein
MAFMWGLTFASFAKFLAGFSSKTDPDRKEPEVYHRLASIFQKNKFGYHTRIMSDFDLLLETAMNQQFLDASTEYYDDPINSKEIEDVELGLNSDLSQADIRHLNKDKGGDHHESKKCFRYPARFGTNYEKSDELSIYKVLPKGEKALY